jgi:hypothetical protein
MRRYLVLKAWLDGGLDLKKGAIVEERRLGDSLRRLLETGIVMRFDEPRPRQVAETA